MTRKQLCSKFMAINSKTLEIVTDYLTDEKYLTCASHK